MAPKTKPSNLWLQSSEFSFWYLTRFPIVENWSTLFNIDNRVKYQKPNWTPVKSKKLPYLELYQNFEDNYAALLLTKTDEFTFWYFPIYQLKIFYSIIIKKYINL